MTTVSASDYGSGAQYQVTISANTLPYPQASALGLPSGGFWIWIELDGTSQTSGGGGEYAGADCGRGPGGGGAAGDQGSVHWSVSGNMISITGVTLNGLGGLPIIITLPQKDFHAAMQLSQFLSPPLSYFPGTAQVTVAR